jgi:hypothetical protein
MGREIGNPDPRIGTGRRTMVLGIGWRAAKIGVGRPLTVLANGWRPARIGVGRATMARAIGIGRPMRGRAIGIAARMSVAASGTGRTVGMGRASITPGRGTRGATTMHIRRLAGAARPPGAAMPMVPAGRSMDVNGATTGRRWGARRPEECARPRDRRVARGWPCGCRTRRRSSSGWIPITTAS